ncbi:uncharacterized protein LOC141649175 [Silene latifolia]|uniref:uncharacterized protein LOC141649175 n=1 Tax=Silene latifolia TaxID=37657 RepID=UPI003D76A70E
MGNVVGARPNLTIIQDFVSKNWGKIASPVVQYFQKGWFSFRFETQEAMDDVLRKGPWMVGANSLVLKHWSPSSSYEMDRVAKVTVWVLLRGLDPYLWSDRVLSKIASRLGHPLFADPATTSKSKLSFARVLIKMDVSKTLSDHVVINIPGLGSVSQKIVYEWYPYFYHGCGKLGHKIDFCKWQKGKENTPTAEVVSVQETSQVSASIIASVETDHPELGCTLEPISIVSPSTVRNVDSVSQGPGQRSSPTDRDLLELASVKHSACSQDQDLIPVPDSRELSQEELLIPVTSNQFALLAPAHDIQDNITTKHVVGRLEQGACSEVSQLEGDVVLGNVGSGCTQLGQISLESASSLTMDFTEHHSVCSQGILVAHQATVPPDIDKT